LAEGTLFDHSNGGLAAEGTLGDSASAPSAPKGTLSDSEISLFECEGTKMENPTGLFVPKGSRVDSPGVPFAAKGQVLDSTNEPSVTNAASECSNCVPFGAKVPLLISKTVPFGVKGVDSQSILSGRKGPQSVSKSGHFRATAADWVRPLHSQRQGISTDRFEYGEGRAALRLPRKNALFDIREVVFRIAHSQTQLFAKAEFR
jgi:hypothetical protein